MIHLIKLCVGASSVEDLLDWREMRRAQGYGRADGLNVHRTRMMPRQRDEVLEGGSLYWVMAGHIRCRQRIVGLEPATDSGGRACCDILLDPEVVRTSPQPKRPFQGWRYLRREDAPADRDAADSEGDPALADELAKFGLI